MGNACIYMCEVSYFATVCGGGLLFTAVGLHLLGDVMISSCMYTRKTPKAVSDFQQAALGVRMAICFASHKPSQCVMNGIQTYCNKYHSYIQ